MSLLLFIAVVVDDKFNESSVNIKRSLSINTKAKNKFHDKDDGVGDYGTV